jgi:uncharacterized protein
MEASTTARPLAVVTGASAGIGFELARQFAENGFDLLVTAEDPTIDTAAAQLRSSGTAVSGVQADLRDAAGVDALWDAVQATGRPLAAAALNAGVGKGGPFVDNPIEDELAIIDLNVRSTVLLAKHVLRAMAARGEGRVLFTSSVASTMPGPYQAVYNASKSFVQSFAEAVAEELADAGVTVTSLMPGPTDTEFFERGDLMDTKLGQGPKDDPAQVAAQGFEGLMKGERKVLGGSVMSRSQAVVNSVLPDRLKSKGHAKMAEPGSAG